MRSRKPFIFAAVLTFVLAAFFSNASAQNKKAQADQLFREAAGYFDAKKFDQAIATLEQAMKYDPNDPRCYAMLGTIYMDQKRSLDDAITAFTKSISLNPKYAEGYHNLGVIYAQHYKDYDVAEDYFNKALAVDPRFVKSLMGLGYVYLFEKRDAARALKCFEQVVEIEPQYPEAQYGLGMALIILNKKALALKPISQLHELNRNDLAAGLEGLMERSERLFVSNEEEIAARAAAEASTAQAQSNASAPAARSSSGDAKQSNKGFSFLREN